MLESCYCLFAFIWINKLQEIEFHFTDLNALEMEGKWKKCVGFFLWLKSRAFFKILVDYPPPTLTMLSSINLTFFNFV